MEKFGSKIVLEDSKNNFNYKKNDTKINIKFNRVAFIFFFFFVIYLIYSIHLIHLGSLKSKVEKINNIQSRICANTEREVLKILEGDCDTAIGALSKIEGNNIILSAELFSVDGKNRYFIKEIKEINSAKELGRKVGEALKFQSKGSYKR